jgi:hypothetical protein
MQSLIACGTLNSRLHDKSLKFVPALRATTGPKKAVPFWAT